MSESAVISAIERLGDELADHVKEDRFTRNEMVEASKALELRLAAASDQRISDLKDWLKVTLEPALKPSRGWEVALSLLTPKTLGLLVAGLAILVGGTPVAMMIVDRYLPPAVQGNVQINSNNEATPPPEEAVLP